MTGRSFGSSSTCQPEIPPAIGAAAPAGLSIDSKIAGANNICLPRTLQFFMLQFVCDYCENLKRPDEIWITGVAAENVGTQAARREVVIDPTWRRERALLPFAVHFCSIECKDSYLAELFDKPAALLEVQGAVTEPDGRRLVRAKRKPLGEAIQSRTQTRKKTRGR